MLKQNLAALMEKRKITIAELSEETGISVPTLKKLRTIENSNPTLDSLTKLAEFFNVSLDSLTRQVHEEEGRYSVPLIKYDRVKDYLNGDIKEIKTRINVEKNTNNVTFCVISDVNLFSFNAGCVFFCSSSKVKKGDYFIGANGALYKLISDEKIYAAVDLNSNSSVVDESFIRAKIVKVKYEVDL